MIYLDYQATTPLAPEVFEAMLPWLRDHFANPHSAHRMGRAAAAAVEVARGRVMEMMPAGGRVIFTSGATEALNIAIQGMARRVWAKEPQRLRVLAPETEHAAVRDTVLALAAEGFEPVLLPVGGHRAAVQAVFGHARPAHRGRPQGLHIGPVHTGIEEDVVGDLLHRVQIRRVECRRHERRGGRRELLREDEGQQPRTERHQFLDESAHHAQQHRHAEHDEHREVEPGHRNPRPEIIRRAERPWDRPGPASPR